MARKYLILKITNFFSKCILTSHESGIKIQRFFTVTFVLFKRPK